MDTGVISVRYARALFKAACEQGLEDKIYAIMQTLAQAYLQVSLSKGLHNCIYLVFKPLFTSSLE